MDAALWSAVFDGAMVAVTVTGFIFVWWQLKNAIQQLHNDHRTAQAATVEHLYCRMNDIHKIFLQYPKLRGFFYGNFPLPEDGSKLRVRVDTASELMADFFQQVFLELDLLPQDAADGWRSYMTSVLDNSQVLQGYVKKHRHWYPSNFVGRLLNPAD